MKAGRAGGPPRKARPPKGTRAGLPAGWGRSSVGRALEWHSRGQGFDSPRLHHPPDSRFAALNRSRQNPLPSCFEFRCCRPCPAAQQNSSWRARNTSRNTRCLPGRPRVEPGTRADPTSLRLVALGPGSPLRFVRGGIYGDSEKRKQCCCGPNRRCRTAADFNFYARSPELAPIPRNRPVQGRGGRHKVCFYGGASPGRKPWPKSR